MQHKKGGPSTVERAYQKSPWTSDAAAARLKTPSECTGSEPQGRIRPVPVPQQENRYNQPTKVAFRSNKKKSRESQPRKKITGNWCRTHRCPTTLCSGIKKSKIRQISHPSAAAHSFRRVHKKRPYQSKRSSQYNSDKLKLHSQTQ